MEHILLLGGNGRTGRHVLDLALARGIHVNALVRDASKLETQSELLTVVEGSPMNADDVAKAAIGVRGVIATLNNGRTSDNPWAKSTSPVDLMNTSIKNAIAATSALDRPRFAVLSAAGVGDSFEHSPWIFRQLIQRTNMKQAYDDHNAVEGTLRGSNVDWTLARPMGLSDSDPKAGAKIIESYDGDPKPAMKISRVSVARFLLDSLTDDSLIGKAPVISER